MTRTALRKSLAILLIIIGFGVGLYVGLQQFYVGMELLRSKRIVDGILQLVVWAELFGILASLIFVVPGVMILKSHLKGDTGKVSKSPL